MHLSFSISVEETQNQTNQNLLWQGLFFFFSQTWTPLCVSLYYVVDMFVCLHIISVSCIGYVHRLFFPPPVCSLQYTTSTSTNLLLSKLVSFLALQQPGLLDQSSTERDIVPCPDHHANCSSRAKPGCIDPPRPPVVSTQASSTLEGMFVQEWVMYRVI